MDDNVLNPSNLSTLADVKEPKIDIHYTNGNLDGKFKFKFKQNFFKIFMGLLGSTCIAHGAYLHYENIMLQDHFDKQQTLFQDSIKREVVCESDLRRTEEFISHRFDNSFQSQPPQSQPQPVIDRH